MLTSKRSHLGRSKMLGFLDELAATENKAISLYFPQGMPQARVENLLGRVLAASAIPPDIAEVIAGSRMGAAFFWSPPQAYLILPP
ncbi:MAG TPA: hypothetical protein VIH69_04130, partial [Dehalococcoidia bacterium]